MDRETNPRDNNSNVEALASQESDFSNKDQEQDIETLYNGKKGFSTKNKKIGVDSNKEILSDKAIQATVRYSGLGFIVLNL